MGWASTLISPPDGDLAAFLALARAGSRRWRRRACCPAMASRSSDARGPARLAARPPRRPQRRADLAALADGPARIPELTRRVYTDTPAALLPAAERNVLAHLIDLERKLQGQRRPAPRPAALGAATASR